MKMEDIVTVDEDILGGIPVFKGTEFLLKISSIISSRRFVK
jgi:hypothetical protein